MRRDQVEMFFADAEARMRWLHRPAAIGRRSAERLREELRLALPQPVGIGGGEVRRQRFVREDALVEPLDGGDDRRLAAETLVDALGQCRCPRHAHSPQTRKLVT